MTTLIALDVLLRPDEATRKRAEALNARLRDSLPTGFALDETHVPHVTVLQRFVRGDDLERVLAAVERVNVAEDGGALRLHAGALTGSEFGTQPGTLVASITIEATPALLALHRAIVAAVTPFSESGGAAAAFVTTADEPEINATTVSYVERFVPLHSGEAYLPHMTVGLGREDVVKRLEASFFNDFEFSPSALAVYQLGDLGAARRLLRSWPRRGT